jgi:hypothetical protein
VTSSGFFVPITEQIDAYLSDLPTFQQQRLFENALNKALDRDGWPTELAADPTVPFYVVVFRHGQIQGHVGPLLDQAAADRCARSWRSSGTTVQVTRRAIGPCLTNAGIAARDIYYP